MSTVCVLYHLYILDFNSFYKASVRHIYQSTYLHTKSKERTLFLTEILVLKSDADSAFVHAEYQILYIINFNNFCGNQQLG